MAKRGSAASNASSEAQKMLEVFRNLEPAHRLTAVPSFGPVTVAAEEKCYISFQLSDGSTPPPEVRRA